MFSIYNLMNPRGQPQHHCGFNPCFPNFDHQRQCQSGPWDFFDRSGEHRREMPPFEQAADICAPLAHIMQMVNQQSNAESGVQERNVKRENKCTGENKSSRAPSKCTESKTETGKTKGLDSFQQELQNIIGNVMSAYNLPHEEPSQIWHQKVDCRGFESKNIRVKIEEHALLIKAFKKEQSSDGLRTSTLRKVVAFPENIDTKKIRCKLSPNGVLIIEALFVDKNKRINDQHDFVKELMQSVFPGLEHVLKSCSKESENEEEIADSKSNKKNTNAKKSQKTETNQEQTVKKDDEKYHKKSKDQPEEKYAGSNVKQENQSENKQDGHTKMEAANIIDPQSKQLIQGQENVSVNNEAIVTFPDTQEPEVHEDDGASAASEDSFVLLSQLEKENENETNNDEDGTSNNLVLNENGTDTTTLAIAAGDDECEGDNEDDSNGKEDEELNIEIEKENVHDKVNTDRFEMSNMLHDSEDVSKNGGYENDDMVIFRLEMPSYNPESMKVDFDDNKRLLTITANKETKSGVPADSITKSIVISNDVDVNGLQCYFRDGSLIVTAPRKTIRRSIPIKV